MAKDISEARNGIKGTNKPGGRKGEGRERQFTTVSGVPIDQLYTMDSIRDLDYTKDLADPGNPPYTRGIHPTMYRSKLWTMRQFSGFGTAADTNERFHYL